MYVNDSSSSIENHRRRIAAEEKRADERLASERVAREDGTVRQRGELPARTEVDRFRALMQRPGEEKPAQTAAGKDEAGNGSPKAAQGRPGAPAPKAGDGAPPARFDVAERFRSLLQRAFDARPQPQSPDGDARGAAADATADDAPRASERPADASPRTPVQTAASPRSGNGAEAAAADERQAAGQVPAEPARDADDAAAAATAQVVAPDSADADERPVRSEARQADDGAAPEAAERAAEKAARGGAEARPVLPRKMHESRDDGSDASSSRFLYAAMPPAALPGDVPLQPMPSAAAADGPQQAAAAGMLAPALAELLEKHVKQLLVSDTRASRQRSQEVLLRMKDDVLPGTDLWLTRTDRGWQLRADVRSRDAYDTLMANRDDLIRRFADSSLGELSIEPVFHGDLAPAAAPARVSSAAPRLLADERGGRNPR